MSERVDPTVSEHLSAWLDGELAAAETRFLQRRLARDAALRAQFERWELAAACLRGQRVRAMPATLAATIAAAVAAEPRRRGPWPWLATAAALVLVAVLMPSAPVHDPAHESSMLATPSSPSSPLLPVLADDDPAVARMSPAAPAVSELPLADSAQLRPWPRSPVLAGSDDQTPFAARAERLLPAGPEAAPAAAAADREAEAADAARRPSGKKP